MKITDWKSGLQIRYINFDIWPLSGILMNKIQIHKKTIYFQVMSVDAEMYSIMPGYLEKF